MVEQIFDLVITGIFSFGLGIILHPMIKDSIYHRYISSPIEISSEYLDRMGNSVNVKDFFNDILTLTNNSDRVIRIKEIGVSIKLVEEVEKGCYFESLVYESRESLMGNINRDKIGPLEKNYSTKSYTRVSIAGQRIGITPDEIKPKESKTVHFGLRGSDGVMAKVLVEPKFDYKKAKLEYEIGFR